MSREAFSHVDTWVFDLDNTLYPAGSRLFDQIEALMIDYITETLNMDRPAANVLRKSYWAKYGTTLAGLMAEHDVDPVPFLDKVHQVDLSALTPSPALRDAIFALPGRKVIYTNAARAYGHRLVGHLGLDGCFSDLYAVEDAGFAAKPHAKAFERVFTAAKLKTSTAAMFEDDPRNLAVPHALGMKCVLIGAADPAPHLHFQTHDLARFLRVISA
ncbi:MAG: pyrimidine 5'-nucleotidase [Paracoccaceae bacterium]